MRFVKLHNQTYAVGLFWQSRTNGAASRKVLLQMARERAREFTEDNYNCVVVRAQEYALGNSPEPVGKTQVFSLAAALRLPAGTESFLGVFHLGESLWWVCCISKGLIVTFGDAVYGTKEEAELGANGIVQLLAAKPALEVFCATREESEAWLSATVKPESRLEDLFPSLQKRRKSRIKIAGALALVAALLGGLKLHGHLQEVEEEARRLMLTAIDARHKQELKDHPEIYFTMSWREAPAAAPAGEQCVRAMLPQPISALGWLLDEMTCAPGKALVVTRSYTHGAAYSVLPEKTRLATAQKAVSNLTLPSLPKREGEAFTELPGKEEAAAHLYQITQNIGAKLQNLTWDAPEQTVQDDITLIAPWQRAAFSLEEVPAGVLGDVFAALEYPGITINSVIRSGESWKIQGSSYAKTK